MLDTVTIEDIIATLRVKKDVNWFIDFFEISIEDMVSRFEDLIVESASELTYELEMEEQPEEYEDR